MYKILELQNELSERGYNREGFKINYAHRHPAFNKGIGGASMSFHMLGKAIDIDILDINNDHVVNQRDKKIVLGLLENKIIKNSGGIGKYPWSMTIHFDVRGYYARWDHM